MRIDRDKLRSAICRLDTDRIRNMLDDAIGLLPPAKLAKLAEREAEMKDLAGREADVWRQVAARVDTKQAKGYEDAVGLLKKLAQLAEFRGSQVEFRQRVTDLCDRYSRLSGFRSRVQKEKLVE